MSKPKVTERDTKAAILAAYEELNAEIKQLQSDKSRPRIPISLEAASGAPVSSSAAAAPTPQGAQAAGIDGLLIDLERLRGSFGGTASALQAKLTAEAERLSALRAQADLQTSQLKGLHQITPAKDTLASLIHSYNDKETTFRAEIAGEEQSFGEELEEKRADWRKEKELHQMKIAERDLALATRRKRDEEEYTYNLRHQREIEADQHNQEQKKLAAALDAEKAEREKQWQEREAELALRETTYQTLKERVSSFDERLDKAAKAATAEGFAIANRQAKNAADLLAKENGGIIKVKELKIASLKETLHKQEAEIAALAAKLSEAQRRAQELAVKAIEGASNESSFVAIKEIALEQAKAQPKR